MPEAEKKVAARDEAPAPAKTNDYVLKSGAEHSCIIKGEFQTVKGDGKRTVPLTDEQAMAFKDKLLASEDAKDALGRRTITFVVGEETGGRPTIVEGAADAAAAQDLGKEERESEESDETNSANEGKPSVSGAQAGNPGSAAAAAEGRQTTPISTPSAPAAKNK